jgi:hypothetical protein
MGGVLRRSEQQRVYVNMAGKTYRDMQWEQYVTSIAGRSSRPQDYGGRNSAHVRHVVRLLLQVWRTAVYVILWSEGDHCKEVWRQPTYVEEHSRHGGTMQGVRRSSPAHM